MSKQLSLASHALVGWAICGATIAVGRQVVSMQATLIVHALVAPAAFAVLTWHHVKRFPRSSAAATACAMTAIVVGLDALVVAPFFEGSYAMFRSLLGTWVPFVSIAAASFLAARATTSRGAKPVEPERQP